jgi:serine acetyltransferase
MFEYLRADLQHYSRFCYNGRPIMTVLLRILYGHPAALAVIWYRFGSAAWRLRWPFLRQGLQVVYLLGMPLVRVYSGVQIQPQTQIGPGLAILHFGGVVITRDCTIGANCLLYHNVNIVTMRSQRGATIGDHFYAGTGATILGSVSIEDNVTVGAGAVLTKSAPKDAVIAGVPARILRFREPGEDPSENRTLPNRSSEWLEPSGHGNARLGSRVPTVTPAAPRGHISKPPGAEGLVREPATPVRKQQ